jgi:membrane associated rhomboid family serine protease
MRFNIPETSKGVRALIIASVACWILELIPGIGAPISYWLSLTPVHAFGGGQLWRLVTYMFVHDPSGPFHVLFNMLTLWMFGNELEQLWGTKKFVILYFLGGIGAALLSIGTIVSPAMWHLPVIGASGAVLTILTVYAFTFPDRRLLLFFLIPVNVVTAVIIFGAISLFGTFASWGNVSHLTHLGGILVGFAYVKLLPRFEDWQNKVQYSVQESKRKAEVAQENEAMNYYEHVVDPVLKKISASGMDSLTKEEKKILEEASKRKLQEEERKGKVLRFKR